MRFIPLTHEENGALDASPALDIGVRDNEMNGCKRRTHLP